MDDLNMATANKKWQALTQCRSEYDGVFFYGVRTTGIFCKPSCKSREPKRENVEFFDNAQDAVSSGFRPCKRCRPDLIIYDPDDDTASRASVILENYCCDKEKLEQELKGLGVSRNHLVQVFQRKFGVTPAKYTNSLKMVKASELLSQTDTSIIDIALLCGFKSLSAFYDLFRKEKGMTPKAYRKSKIST
jgi:AraC family transcriptional regulator of adaptative response / methylphosphotriester-DNA alkyltransferase methyltransferase